jgi:hypothetical protein
MKLLRNCFSLPNFFPPFSLSPTCPNFFTLREEKKEEERDGEMEETVEGLDIPLWKAMNPPLYDVEKIDKLYVFDKKGDCKWQLSLSAPMAASRAHEVFSCFNKVNSNRNCGYYGYTADHPLVKIAKDPRFLDPQFRMMIAKIYLISSSLEKKAPEKMSKEAYSLVHQGEYWILNYCKAELEELSCRANRCWLRNQSRNLAGWNSIMPIKKQMLFAPSFSTPQLQGYFHYIKNRSTLSLKVVFLAGILSFFLYRTYSSSSPRKFLHVFAKIQGMIDLKRGKI